MTVPEDLPAAFSVIDVRAAGGFLQDGDHVTAQVYLEIDGTTDDVTSEAPIHTVTVPLTMDLDTYFKLMARLEHAGKTALMMPI